MGWEEKSQKKKKKKERAAWCLARRCRCSPRVGSSRRLLLRVAEKDISLLVRPSRHLRRPRRWRKADGKLCERATPLTHDHSCGERRRTKKGEAGEETAVVAGPPFGCCGGAAAAAFLFFLLLLFPSFSARLLAHPMPMRETFCCALVYGMSPYAPGRRPRRSTLDGQTTSSLPVLPSTRFLPRLFVSRRVECDARMRIGKDISPVMAPTEVDHRLSVHARVTLRYGGHPGKRAMVGTADEGKSPVSLAVVEEGKGRAVRGKTGGATSGRGRSRDERGSEKVKPPTAASPRAGHWQIDTEEWRRHRYTHAVLGMAVVGWTRGDNTDGKTPPSHGSTARKRRWEKTGEDDDHHPTRVPPTTKLVAPLWVARTGEAAQTTLDEEGSPSAVPVSGRTFHEEFQTRQTVVAGGVCRGRLVFRLRVRLAEGVHVWMASTRRRYEGSLRLGRLVRDGRSARRGRGEKEMGKGQPSTSFAVPQATRDLPLSPHTTPADHRHGPSFCYGGSDSVWQRKAPRLPHGGTAPHLR